MDKKIRKVTKKIRQGEKLIKAGKKSKSLKVLKKAVKSNVKLANYDQKVRDPEIHEYEKMKKKGC